MVLLSKIMEKLKASVSYGHLVVATMNRGACHVQPMVIAFSYFLENLNKNDLIHNLEFI